MPTTPDENFADEELQKLLFSSLSPKRYSKKSPLTFKGMKPEKTKKLSEMKKHSFEKKLNERVSKLINEKQPAKLNFRDWKNNLEVVFNQLTAFRKSHKTNCKAETLTSIARLYLIRSILFRSKGFEIPPKKIEALTKGLEFINESLGNEDSNKALAWQIKAVIYLELEKINKLKENVDFENVLKTAKEFSITNLKQSDINVLDISTLYDVWICLRYYKLQKDHGFDLTNNEDLQNILKLPPNDIYFERARTYYLLNKFSEMKLEFRNTVNNNLSNNFSEPLWFEVINFLKELKSKDEEGNSFKWKELALTVYETCENYVVKTPNVFLLLHWSSLRDLYNLAFLAADNDLIKQIEIADAVKNRTLERYTKHIDQEELADEREAFDRFVVFRSNRILRTTRRNRIKDFTNVPKDTIAIHFFYNHLENMGYAITYDGKSESSLKRYSFNCDELFNSFLTWQTNYSLNGIRAEEEKLIELCKYIGSKMHFLFDSIPEGKSIIFIPHDFFRRLPLHAAINEKENGIQEILLENHKCYYSPSWSIRKEVNSIETQNRFLLKYDEKYSYENINTPDFISINSLEELKKYTIPASLLVILCHGTANIVNPFESKLHLNTTAIKLSDLITNGINYENSHIFIGACETDFVPPLTNPLDEHLSISIPFLLRGASEIISTIYKVYPEELESLVLTGADFESLEKYYSEQLKKYEDGFPGHLYNIAAFRMLKTN